MKMDDFEELKKLITSILISCPLQMTVGKLNRDFVEQVGFHIPFSKFGFRSLDQCLNAMKDILQVRGTGMHAEIVVHVSSKSAHIDKLIAHQKTKPLRKQHFGNRPKHSRRSRAIPILTNHHSGNVQVYEQRRKSISSPEQISSPSPPLSYIAPPLRAPKYSPNNVGAKTNQPQDLFASENFDRIPSLMLRSVLPPRDFVQSGNFQHQTKQETSPLSTKIPNLVTRAENKSQLYSFDNVGSISVDSKFTNYSPNNIDDYIHLGAIPKEPIVTCNPMLQETQDEDIPEIYSSDEEEPLNMRVPLKVQQNLQLLINNYEEGIWCGKIPQIYQQMFNKELDYEEYGYKSLIQMCMDLKTIFFWYRPDKGDFKLYDRAKPPPKDLDKHYKQSEFIKTWSYLNSQPSNEPAVADIEELISMEPEEYYPPDVVLLMDEIPRQFIPENQEDEYIDVIVGEVYDPSKFWLMLKDHSPLLDILMDDMQPFYMNCPELKIPPHMVKEGLYCTTIYNREYHRAIIVNLLPHQKDKVKVFYIDYGTVSSTLVANLHFLHRNFFKLPQQAIRARLASIYPPTVNTMWSSESSSRFLDLVRMKNLVAHLYHIDYTQQILEVFLVDTTGDVDLYMNDTLVEEGYAIFMHEEQKQSPLSPRFIPKVDCLHLVPTFDEMEQGLVPNASEMIRLQKVGVPIEQILSQYFTHVNAVETNNSETSKTTQRPPEKRKYEKRSSVAIRRSQLNSMAENRLIHESESQFSDDALVSSTLDSRLTSASSTRNSPSPELIVTKPPMRPPPGFESIQEQKIKITTAKVNGGNVLNTVVTETTNIGANNTENFLNYLFRNVGALSNQNQTVPNVPDSAMMQTFESSNYLNQLMLLRNHFAMNNTPQQTHMLRNQNVYAPQQMLTPTYPNHNLFNANIPNQQFSYPNTQNMHHSMSGAQPPYYNQVLNPLRLHMQESIKELLLSENRVILNRFLFIVKRRLLTPGVHQGLFNLIPGIINKSVIYPPDTLTNIYKEALCFLNDEDIIDLANEAKTYALLMQSNSAATQTQFLPSVGEIDNIKIQQLNLRDSETNTVTSSTEYNSGMNTVNTDQINIEHTKLVSEIDFQDNKLHIIRLENEAYAMVTEVLQIVNKKMPIERVRKCIVMTDPSISVLDIRLQEHGNILEELARYMYVDSSCILHVVPITFVPKLISIVGNRRDLASNFHDFLTKVNFTSNTNLIC